MKVLIPIDGSEHSRKALQRGLEMAEKQGAQVTVMTVAPAAGTILDEMRNIQDKLNEEYRNWLEEAKAMFAAKGIKVETVFEIGLVPGNNIIRLAEEEKFDRIIMGATGMNGLARILMGSTASKVVAHAPCEVTLVR